MKAEDVKALIYIDSTGDVALTEKEEFLLDNKIEYFKFYNIPFYIVHYDTVVDFLPEIKNHISINNKVFIKNKNINILDFYSYDLDATYIISKNKEITLYRENNNPSIPTVVLEDILLRKPKHADNVSGCFSIISENNNHLISENSTNMSHTGTVDEIISAIPFMRRISKDTGTKIVLHLEKEMLEFMERMMLQFDFIGGVNLTDESFIHYDLKEMLDTFPSKNKDPWTVVCFLQEGLETDKDCFDLGFKNLDCFDLKEFPTPEYNVTHINYNKWRVFNWEIYFNNYKGDDLYFIGDKKTFDSFRHPKIKSRHKGDLYNEVLCIAKSKEFHGQHSYASLIANDLGKPCYMEDFVLNRCYLDLKNVPNNYTYINDLGETVLSLNPPAINKKLDFKNVTLAIVDCVEVDRCLRAIEHCKKQADFGDIKFLTSLETDSPYGVKINPISNILEYSNFMLGELNDHIDTEYCLVIQHDGFIYNNNLWTDEFFNYDYIGAMAIGYDGPEWIQNGGFSLRSKKLLNLIQEEYKKTGNPNLAEDYYICSKNKDLVESSGLRFAPKRLADKFSTEPLARILTRDADSFGFHYFIR